MSVQRIDPTNVDELRNPIDDPVTIGTVWGRVTPLRGKEATEAQTLQASYSHMVTLRDSSFARGILTSDNLMVKNVPYQIRSITETEFPGFIVLYAERGVPT